MSTEQLTHTPGPWTAYEMTHYGEPGTGFWHVDPIGEPDDTWSEADARLIAAAPELLVALKLILQTHDVVCKGEECGISGIDLARAAIAKAESR